MSPWWPHHENATGPCELTLTLQKHQPQKLRSVGSCHPSARSHPAPTARLLSLQPKAFKFWEIKQQNKQTNEQKARKRGREGSWGRWYWPITVRRFCTRTGERRRRETVVTMATCGPWGWHKLLLLLHLPPLPHSSPHLHGTINPPPWSNRPCSISPAEPRGVPPPAPAVLPSSNTGSHCSGRFFWGGGRSAFGGTLPSFQQGKTPRPQLQTCPTRSPWKSIGKTCPRHNSEGNNCGASSPALDQGKRPGGGPHGVLGGVVPCRGRL